MIFTWLANAWGLKFGRIHTRHHNTPLAAFLFIRKHNYTLPLLAILSTTFILVIIGQFNANAATIPTADATIFLPLITKPSQPLPFGALHTGDGTWYPADGGGNCTFPPSPENMMVAAMNHVDYANSAICGSYVQVTGPEGRIIVRIVDQCADCPINDIDLSYEAFSHIADPQLGRVSVSWQLVSYPLPDPIVYHFKDGSNQWWTAIQIRNHSNPIKKLEYRDASGTFHEIDRLSYNYFVKHTPGLGIGPYTFRVTDYFGQTLLDEGIPHIENGDVAGGGQFPQP